MQVSIDEYMKKIKDQNEEKKILKKCFLTDIKAKQINRFPSSFLILKYNFSQRDVLFASKIYLDKYATFEEKERYYQVLKIYISSLSKHSQKIYLNYQKSFYTFFKYRLSDEKFYNLKKEFMCDIEELLEYPRRYDALYANSDERELYKINKETIPQEYIKNKFYYEVCSNVKWNPQKIYSLSLEFGKPIPYILNMANLYVTNVLHQESLTEVLDLLQKYYSKMASKNPIKIIFENLEILEKEQDIIDYLINNKIEITKLREYLNDYLNLYKKDLNQIQLNDLKDALSKKIEVYQNYLNAIKEENQISCRKVDSINYEDLIIEFINGNYTTKEEFCNFKGIKLGDFDEMIFNLSKNNQKLYFEFCQTLKLNNNQFEEQNIEIIKKIISLIRYGVLENNKVRYFDILDYFTMTNLSFNKILNLCKKNFSTEDYNYLLAFVNKNRNLNLITDKNLEKILSEKNVIGVEFDSHNMPIAGTGYEVSREEKIEILNELKSQNLPLFYQTYKLALNRKFNIVHQKTK